MRKKFDFQMFNEEPTLNIPGIDADVLADLAREESLNVSAADSESKQPAEVEQQSDAATGDTGAQAETQQGITESEMGDEYPNADADSDNKQVGDVPKGNIPYPRFKQEIEKRKAAEEELAAIKAKLEQPPAQSAQQMQPVVEQQTADLGQAPQQSPNKAEIMKAVTSEAIRRAKVQMGLTDEDVANMDFADDIECKMQFNALVQQETNEIFAAGRKIAQERMEFEQGVQETTNQFGEFVDEFQQLPDSADRWNYIAEERFLQLPPAQQVSIKAAFERLQNKKGTPADFLLTKFYCDQASAEYDTKNGVTRTQVAGKQAASKINAAAKVEAAQALPKAVNVGGASKTTVISADDVASALNEPGTDAWDKLPEDIKYKILNGIPL